MTASPKTLWRYDAMSLDPSLPSDADIEEELALVLESLELVVTISMVWEDMVTELSVMVLVAVDDTTDKFPVDLDVDEEDAEDWALLLLLPFSR